MMSKGAMVVWVEKIMSDEVVYHLEVHCILHHLAHLDKVRYRAVVTNSILLIFLMQWKYKLWLPST